MGRFHPPLRREKEYGAEIKIHGTDQDRRGKREEKGWARKEDVPKLRKYARERRREATRQVVEMLDGADEAVVELRKGENAASSRASRQSKLATWDGLLKKLCYRGTCLSIDVYRVDCGRLDRFRGTEAPTLRQIGGSKAPRRARPSDLGDGVEDECNWPLSKPRTGTSAADRDHDGRRRNGLGLHRWLATAKHSWREEFGCRDCVVHAA